MAGSGFRVIGGCKGDARLKHCSEDSVLRDKGREELLRLLERPR
jgi:hypothetical protein